MRMWKSFLVFMIFWGVMAEAAAKNRVALVIGNSEYASSPLKNPANDAKDMATALRNLGFDVIEKQNLSRRGMRQAMRAFGKKLTKEDVGLFYFAGHGMQVEGRNYLMPVDADVQSEDEVQDEGIDANSVLRKMKGAGNSLNIVILDACRNNPFSRSFRSGTRGLARMDGPVGSLIAYATAPGSVAADGAESNGVYTKYLLSALKIPNLTIEQVFKKVRADVEAETVGKQIPWETSSLKGEFKFNINVTINHKNEPGQNTGLPTRALANPTLELTLWNDVKNSNNKSMLEAYLRRFPSGTFSELARIKLESMAPTVTQKKQKEQDTDLVAASAHEDKEVVGSSDDAYDYYDAEKYADAFPIFLYLVNRGHQDSQNYIGWLYMKGYGTQKNYPAALKWYGKSAARGNAWGQQKLGYMYREGLGVPVDYEAAVKWYRKAAEQEDVDAEANLGYMYQKGWGVKANDTLAFEWYFKSAQQGDDWAQFKVGYYYDVGKGLPKDAVQAVQWYSKSAKQGNEDAQNNLGLLYEYGRGVEKDDKAAFDLYLKSAEKGHAEAQDNVAIMYEEGRGVKKDPLLASQWYLKSALQGYDDAQNRLGYLYMKGIGVPQDYLMAAKWYKKAAEQGDAWGQQKMGYLYLNGYGLRQDYVKAKSWFDKAAAQDDMDAKSNLGWMHHKGLGMEIDLKVALSWYLTAAEQGDAWAEHKVGYFYDEGFGTAQDYEKAREWYIRSAKQGNQYAQYNLGLIYEKGHGVKIDLIESKRWYQQASDAGYSDADDAIKRLAGDAI